MSISAGDVVTMGEKCGETCACALTPDGTHVVVVEEFDVVARESAHSIRVRSFRHGGEFRAWLALECLQSPAWYEGRGDFIANTV